MSLNPFAANSALNSTADSLASFLEPEVVLPSQYFDAVEGGLQGGERKLMAALLSDGIEAYIFQCTSRNLSYAKGETIVGVDAREWVETQDPDYVFSFDNVCECLGLSAEYLRLGLSRYVNAVRTKERIGGESAGESAGELATANASGWRKIRRPRKR